MRFGRRATWGAVGLALGLAASGLAILTVPRAALLPADFMGHVVTSTGPVVGPEQHTFEVRHNCRIGRFGVAPWLKPGLQKDEQWERMTRLALASMGMPRAAHDGAIARLRGPSAGDVTVGNTDGSFDTTYRVGNRWVACLQSQTRFSNDAWGEPADAHPYEYGGKVYRLAIIRKCGNVTLLPPPPVFAAPVPLPQPAVGGPGYLPPPFIGGPGYHSPAPGGYIVPIPPVGPGGGTGNPLIVHNVPEPSTWTLIAVAVAGFFIGRRKP